MTDVQAVIDEWFLDEQTGRHDLPQLDRWFKGGKALDERLRDRWSGHLQRAADGQLSHWLTSAPGSLAFVVLIDQFTRNIHRGSAAAFALDGLALAAARDAIDRGHEVNLPLVQRVFLYLPFEHDESRASQHEAVKHFEALAAQAPESLADFAHATLKSAREHAAIIERFGRYPHRNGVLGRDSTEEERDWLAQGGGRFGQ